jgi:hypothetical protein
MERRMAHGAYPRTLAADPAFDLRSALRAERYASDRTPYQDGVSGQQAPLTVEALPVPFVERRIFGTTAARVAKIGDQEYTG